ncbi:MAG: DUF1573 domain-containing protein [Nitrospirota bacterium]
MDNKFYIHLRLFFISFLFVGIFIALNVKEVFSQEKKPIIAFEEERYDFGQIKQGEKITHIYKFKNTGQQTLVLEDIEIPCECTKAVASKEKILPGESEEITVTFDSTGERDRIDTPITIYSNDPNNPIVTLTITGEVIPEINIVPRVLNFGRIERGKYISKKLRVAFNFQHQLKITGLNPSSRFITSKILKITKKETIIQVTINKDAPEGRLSEYVTIMTNSKLTPTTTVLVVADIPPNIGR